MTSFHIFRQCGECFAFHVGAGRFVHVTPEAYAYLELRGTMPADDAAKRFLSVFGDIPGEGWAEEEET